MSLLYPDPAHPYYIVTPSYDAKSAGIRGLHILCHCLNIRGQTAYLVQDPLDAKTGKTFASGTDLLTPHLTAKVLQDHSDHSKLPIVLYPETIPGNPFSASCVVRYVCNFPGLLSGDLTYASDELVFAYSKTLAEAAGFDENVLFIPVVDTRIFKLPPNGTERQGSCFYADKFRKVHGGVPYDITANSLEITRHEPKSQSTEEVAAILKRSEIFYAYENTALAIEAVLCGCPAVFIPNPFLDGVIASAELGPDGFAWGADPAEVRRATATVAQGARNYLATLDTFWLQLDNFIDKSQTHADRPHAKPIVNFDLSMNAAFDLAPVLTSDSLFKACILDLLRRLPFPLTRELGKFLCTVGIQRAGAALQDLAAYCPYKKVEIHIKP